MEYFRNTVLIIQNKSNTDTILNQVVIRLAGALHVDLLRRARTCSDRRTRHTVRKYSIDLEHVWSTRSSERNTLLYNHECVKSILDLKKIQSSDSYQPARTAHADMNVYFSRCVNSFFLDMIQF